MSDSSFNNLPSQVWPLNARRAENGVVTIGGVSLVELAETYGTPLMVVDEGDFRARARAMAEAFGVPERVHYAAKAFLCGAVARWVEEEGLSLDVASDNELQIALHAGFPATRITAHGNNKGDAFLRRCVTHGVGRVVLDSFMEIEQLERIACEEDKVQLVLVRTKPGIDAHTHEFIATSHEDQKFGFSLASGSSLKAAGRVLSSPWLRLEGLHCHVGSQVFDADGFSLAAERVLRLLDDILESYGASLAGGRESLARQLTTLDLGGGYGIAYTADERPLDVKGVARDLLRRVREHAEELDLSMPTVMVEPGRAIVGPSTVTVYRVGTVKDVHLDDDRTRRYLSVDGGMSDNIRPALYGAEYDVRVVSRCVYGSGIPTRVVGSHCESGDIIINNSLVPADVTTGDLLATPATGAYCYAMSSRYNAWCRPAVVSVRDGNAQIILRRETVNDLLALEPDYSET